MKKKFLSTLVILALAFTTILAGTSAAFAGTVVSNTTDKTVKTITAQNRNTVSSLSLKDHRTYTASVTPVDGKNKTIVKIKATKAGTLRITMKASAIDEGRVTVSLHSKESATEKSILDEAVHLTPYNKTNDLFVKLPKSGTYYLKFEARTNLDVPTNKPHKLKFSALLYQYGTAKEQKLKEGKIFYGASPSKGELAYYKVKVPATGYLTISSTKNTTDWPELHVKVTDAKKNSLFSGFEKLYGTYKTRVGVTKGTYYIAVKTTDDAYGLKYTFTKVKESKTGRNKSTATTIKKGGTKKGILSAKQDKNAADWYTFTIGKKQKVKIEAKSLAGGYAKGPTRNTKISLYFYKKGKKAWFYHYDLLADQTKTILVHTPNGDPEKLSSGTYYIKVKRIKDGTGYYRLTWK